MKKILSILLLFSFTFQSFSELTTIIGFDIHRDYIASVLCINRDKPAMHCNGSCYLEKKLAQDERQKDNSGIVKSSMELSLFCTTDQQFDISVFQTQKAVFPPVVIVGYPSPCLDILRPPKV